MDDIERIKQENDLLKLHLQKAITQGYIAVALGQSSECAYQNLCKEFGLQVSPQTIELLTNLNDYFDALLEIIKENEQCIL